MNRMLLRAPSKMRRRPYRARRAVITHAPIEYSAERPAPRWLIVAAGILCALVVAELIFALSVMA